MFLQHYTWLAILAFVGSSFASCGSYYTNTYPITNYGVDSRLWNQSVTGLCDGFAVLNTSFSLTVPNNNTYSTSARAISTFYLKLNSSYELLEMSASAIITYDEGTSGTWTYTREYVVDYCASIVQSLFDPFNLTSSTLSFDSVMNTTISTTDMRNGTGPNITELQVTGVAACSWSVVQNTLLMNQSQRIWPLGTGYQPYRFKTTDWVNSDRAKIDINLSGTFNTENASFGPVVYVGSTPCYKDSNHLLQISPSSSIQNLVFSMEVARNDSWIYLIFEAPDSAPTSKSIMVSIQVSKAPSNEDSAPIYKLWWFWVAIGGGLAVIAGAVVIVIVRRRKGYQSIA